jgi:hypothetical protein
MDTRNVSDNILQTWTTEKHVRRTIAVESIVKKIEVRMRWFGHLIRNG